MLMQKYSDTGVIALHDVERSNLSTPDGSIREAANSPIFPGCSRRSSTGFWAIAKTRRGEAQANPRSSHHRKISLQSLRTNP